MTRAALLAPPLVLVLAGCGGNQNTIAPAGHDERAITQLFWVMFGVACVGFGVIVTLLFLGWCAAQPAEPAGRRRRARRDRRRDRPRRRAADRPARRALRLVGRLRHPLDRRADARLDAGDGPRDRPPVVVGGALHGHARGHRERDPHPGAHARRRRRARPRRDPQLLGAGAEPEGRHDPRAPRTDVLLDADRARASTAGSAPSSAACSTRTWPSRSSPSRRRAFRRVARAQRAAGAPATAQQRGRGVFLARLRRLPPDPRHARRTATSGPT